MATPAALSTNPKADWLADARDAIEALAVAHRRADTAFTADDLRRIVGQPDHANWVGAAFSAAHKLGIIRPVGYTTSRTRSRHHGVIRTWKAAGR